MKADVHPEYYVTQVTCGCGNSFTTRSTRKELKLDICSACHPFFTGKLKFVDTAFEIAMFGHETALYDAAFLEYFGSTVPVRQTGFPSI